MEKEKVVDSFKAKKMLGRMEKKEEVPTTDAEDITMAQFMLRPDIPQEQQEHFNQYYVMLGATMTQGFLKRWEQLEHKLAFDEICQLMNMGDYQFARQLMGKELYSLQLSRSVDAMGMRYGIKGVSSIEFHDMERKEKQKQVDKSWAGKITKGIRGKGGEE